MIENNNKPSKESWPDGIELDLIGHNKKNEKTTGSELTRSLFANGPDDGDGLGTHPVNPKDLKPPAPLQNKP
jgi:hypothetical protein